MRPPLPIGRGAEWLWGNDLYTNATCDRPPPHLQTPKSADWGHTNFKLIFLQTWELPKFTQISKILKNTLGKVNFPLKYKRFLCVNTAIVVRDGGGLKLQWPQGQWQWRGEEEAGVGQWQGQEVLQAHCQYQQVCTVGIPGAAATPGIAVVLGGGRSCGGPGDGAGSCTSHGSSECGKLRRGEGKRDSSP